MCVIASTGKSASASALATVMVAHPVPTALVGTFTRPVTEADIRHTQSFRHEPANQVLPAGVWRLHVGANRLISFDDPQGGGGNAANRQGAFCEAEPDGSWHSSARGRTGA